MWWLSLAFAADPPTPPAVVAPPPLAALEAACDRGDLKACTQAGIRLLGTPTQAGDLAAATRRFEPACASGDVVACRGLGLLLLDGQPPADDLLRGATLLEDACINHRDGGACMRLGDLYHTKGMDFESTRYWAEACSYGFDPGCTRMSEGPPKAPTR